MTLREALAALTQFQFDFLTLSTRERQALAEFNRAHASALRAYQAEQQAQWQEKHPHFTLSSSPHFFQHYERIIIERDHYETAQRQRWRQAHPNFTPEPNTFIDLSHIGDHRRAPPLAITLPPSILALETHKLIRLAFSKDGELFYHYLNNELNHAAKLHANQQSLHNWSSAFFYDYMNLLSTADFKTQLQENTTPLPPLYTRIIQSLTKKHIDAGALICTDGQPLEWLGSLYLFKHLLDTKLTNIDIKGQRLLIVDAATRDILSQAIKPAGGKPHYHLVLTASEHAMLVLAASHGNYEAAEAIAVQTHYKIVHSQHFGEAQLHYQFYRERYQEIFLMKYKAAGALLGVFILQDLLQAAKTHAHDDNACIMAHRVTIPSAMYYLLLSAQRLEKTHKNSLRLSLKEDHTDRRIQQLFNPLQLPSAIVTINDVLQSLHDQFAHLIPNQFERARSLAEAHYPISTIAWPEDWPKPSEDSRASPLTNTSENLPKKRL